METLCLCQLNGYDTGGTIHIIVNNNVPWTNYAHQWDFERNPPPLLPDVAKQGGGFR